MIKPCTICGKVSKWVRVIPATVLTQPEDPIEYDYRCEDHKEEKMILWLLR